MQKTHAFVLLAQCLRADRTHESVRSLYDTTSAAKVECFRDAPTMRKAQRRIWQAVTAAQTSTTVLILLCRRASKAASLPNLMVPNQCRYPTDTRSFHSDPHERLSSCILAPNYSFDALHSSFEELAMIFRFDYHLNIY